MFVVKDLMLFSLTAPGIILILILLSIWAGSSKKISKFWKWSIWSLTILVSYLSTTLVLTKPLMHNLENFAPHVKISSLNYEAIVVLTGGINKGFYDDDSSKIGEQFLRRLISGIELYKSSRRPIIILGGKTLKSEPAESEVAEKILIDLGIPKEKIILDTKSLTTYENLKELEKIITTYKFKKVVLVTSAVHMKRVLTLAQKLNLPVIPYPAAYMADISIHIEDIIPSHKNIKLNAILIYELLGNIKYGLY